MNSQHKEFIREYSNAVIGGNAGLFIGAGFSRSAGFVDWRGLLKDIAKDLGLDIDRESDLVAVAQYHVNSKRTRSRLNQLLIQEFTKESELTENHKIIARLPR